jgi:hypothetical protein
MKVFKFPPPPEAVSKSPRGWPKSSRAQYATGRGLQPGGPSFGLSPGIFRFLLITTRWRSITAKNRDPAAGRSYPPI